MSQDLINISSKNKELNNEKEKLVKENKIIKYASLDLSRELNSAKLKVEKYETFSTPTTSYASSPVKDSPSIYSNKDALK